METINKKKRLKPFKKLGFTFLETTEIVVKIRQLMADYTIFYLKMRNFHWDVVGSDFFELHQEFENEYNITNEHIDILAERIRSFGLKPSMNMAAILERSKVQETNTEKTSIEMVEELLMDYHILHDSMLDVVTASLDIGDNVTEQIITDFMRHLEKRNWMFTSWVK
ncbi:Dps family protein [Seonamhaeicola sp. ML3]|uniref:Dps family protein n=1 Tax=Seonamhaeicola sp. ML3 TaxID=2937786 RepID=UPI00200E29FF|nr:DNA starvation/stationary phase protection protein [Seonamhaeicola sp. ML3]